MVVLGFDSRDRSITARYTNESKQPGIFRQRQSLIERKLPDPGQELWSSGGEKETCESRLLWRAGGAVGRTETLYLGVVGRPLVPDKTRRRVGAELVVPFEPEWPHASSPLDRRRGW